MSEPPIVEKRKWIRRRLHRSTALWFFVATKIGLALYFIFLRDFLLLPKSISVPIVVGLVLVSDLWWVRASRRTHVEADEAFGGKRCRNCGYDLRASKDRCPECGTAISGRR